jgi:hypothetical protein
MFCNNKYNIIFIGGFGMQLQSTIRLQVQPQTYVEKLESHFHKNFIKMNVNTESKKYNLVGYVKMLEQMCRDRGIEIIRGYFPITNNFIYIQDQNGTEKNWTIEEETDYGTYKIFHYDMVSMIDKKKVYKDVDGKLRYEVSLYVSEDMNRFSLDFIVEMFETNAAEATMEAG